MKFVSKCERQFVSNCITIKQKRTDGREFIQGRTLEIVFGKERGCCMVLQGNTHVLAQVSGEISEPKPSSPAEGIIHVNFELSAMASSDAKSYSRASEEFIEAQRCIERCIRDSKCIDLESLCIATASKVWTIRVDIHALNDDGNLTECASIAAISALAHFRRPKVTVVATDVIVYPLEVDELALNILHMPISVNLAVFDAGNHILVDPNELEEKVCDGCYIIGLNAHQEFCFVHRRGVLLLKEDAVKRCEDIAVKRAQEITKIIRTALEDDAYKRKTKAPVGYINLIQTGTILGGKRPMAEISLDTIQNMPEENDVKPVPDKINVDDDQSENSNRRKGRRIFQMESSKAKEKALHILEESEAAVFEGGHSKWGVDTDDEAVEEEVPEIKPHLSDVVVSAVRERMSSDSEEETVYINEDQLDIKTSQTTRGWFTKNPF